MVFKAYHNEKDGSVRYYRHSAFEPRFHRFDGQWFLDVTPTYHFTSDGHQPLRGSHAYLKRIKEIEGHAAARGQMLMWASYLSPSADLFAAEPYPYLGLRRPAVFEAERGIEDARWGVQETAEEGAFEGDLDAEQIDGQASTEQAVGGAATLGLFGE